MLSELKRIDYEDRFSVKCSKKMTPSEAVTAFFSSAPGFVHSLMRFRNFLVRRLGLKIAEEPKIIDPSQIHPGGRIGIFEIQSITSDTAILGSDDSHLDFRVRLEAQDGFLACVTQVQLKNRLGRFYFFFVKPFHRLIVPSMLRAMSRSSES